MNTLVASFLLSFFGSLFTARATGQTWEISLYVGIACGCGMTSLHRLTKGMGLDK